MRLLTIAIAASFLLTILISGAGILWGHWAEIKEWLIMVLPAQAALLGFALTGFYRGDHKH